MSRAQAPGAPRILLLGGEHQHRSIGDIAMLQAAVRQLHSVWPRARLRVVTSAPWLLGSYVPSVDPVSIGSRPARRRLATLECAAGGRLPRTRVEGAIGRLRRGAAILRSASRGQAAGDRLAGCPPASVPEFLDEILCRELRQADLLVAYGGGHLADADPQKARIAFRSMDIATRLGVPYVLTSQGLGPLRSPDLACEARQALTTAVAIGLREPCLGPATLADLGVPRERYTVAGDDALLLLPEPAPLSQDRFAAGLSYRFAGYLGLERGDMERVHAAVATVLEDMGPRFIPLVTSYYGNEDIEAVRACAAPALLDHLPTILADPASVMDTVRSCSLVISTTYHAALFAAASGIPTIGVGKSEYGLAKLHGVRALLGDICDVVDLRDAGAMEHLRLAVTAASATPAGQAARARGRAQELRLSATGFYAALPRILPTAGNRP